MTTRLLVGDCRQKLAELADESVHCIVTSPPYYGLRDYGTAKWEGGDPGCDHVEKAVSNVGNKLGPSGFLPESNAACIGHHKQFRSICGKCGAVRVDGQIGLEATPEAYVAELVAVFRECRRVLRSDGVAWINLGDSYASGGTGGASDKSRLNGGKGVGPTEKIKRGPSISRSPAPGLKPKDLIGIPWMVAFALRADGWWLRQDIIWAKPNPMPESVTDRCTKAHEYLFLLSKSERYYYDAEAIAETSLRAGEIPGGSIKVGLTPYATSGKQNLDRAALIPVPDTRNRRSVWTIPSAPFAEAHFATFPPALVEPCIKAGTSDKGCCPHCGAPWRREVEKTLVATRGKVGKHNGEGRSDPWDAGSSHKWSGGVYGRNEVTTLGWSPSCACPTHQPVPATILDPFAGAGTTGLVADRLGRNAVMIELNPTYAGMMRDRIIDDAPLFAEVMEAAE